MNPTPRPSVLFEASALLGELTGVGTYVRELLPPLCSLVDGTLFLCALKGEVPPWIAAPGGPGEKAAVVRRHLPARGLLMGWHHLQRPRIEGLARRKPDVVHSLNYSVVGTRRPLVVTIHDLWFLRKPGAGSRWGGQLWARDLSRHARRVTHWIAVSETTRDDALELLGLDPAKITVVVEAPRSDFQQPLDPGTAAEIRARLELPESYLLFYGNDDPRKNRQGLETAYARLLDLLPDAPPLVLVGGRRPDPLPHVPILWRPYLSAPDLLATLQGAIALVFPSFYEGFGLPVVEALTAGVPVAASPTGAIPQVAGDCYVQLDPSDPDQMADALASLCADSELQRDLREAGPRCTADLSWERAARETLEVYRRALA